MDFYILKKQEKLVAIPADEQNCKQYLDEGYYYVDKIAACNEKSALKRQQAKQNRFFKTPTLLLLLVLPIIIIASLQITN
jgi:hypothetical protein